MEGKVERQKEMAKFTVYHAKEMPMVFGPYPVFNLENYEKVAVVDVRDVDDTFAVTNHRESDWTTNKEVISSNSRCRSTSVGDVVVDNDYGRAWRCMPHGWETVGWNVV